MLFQLKRTTLRGEYKIVAWCLNDLFAPRHQRCKVSLLLAKNEDVYHRLQRHEPMCICGAIRIRVQSCSHATKIIDWKNRLQKDNWQAL